MKIEQLDTSILIPYARNAKLHNEKQVQAIAGSIQAFGFNNPVLIDKENGIIAGHGRVLAAQLIGMKKVPCIRLSHLSENDKRAYVIADNRLQEIGNGWDQELLLIEVNKLIDIDFDLAKIGMDEFCWDIAVENTDAANDANEEWDGMPEFVQENNPPFKQIIVRFENESVYKEFQGKIKQKLTQDTKSIWYPQRDQDQCNREFVYASKK